MKETLIRWAKMLAIFLFVFFSIISGAGAINYGCDNNENIYIVAGIISMLCAGYSAVVAYYKADPR
jgi:hypothetical protein